jgi:large repetitive protein
MSRTIFGMNWPLALYALLCLVMEAGFVAPNRVMAQTANQPVIAGLNPTSGPTGTRVVILGSNLVDVVAVRFGDSEAAFGQLSAGGDLYADVPLGALTGPVTVVTLNGQATSETVFTVIVIPPPIVISMQPGQGEPGTSVTILGSNFVSVTAVYFNGLTAPFNHFNHETILATVPTNATSGPITVQTPQGTSTSGSSFTVLPPQSPLIESFSPTSGPVGTPVIIQGPNVGKAQTVRFGGVAASFISLGSDRLSASVPEGATSGLITLVAPKGTCTSSTPFTVTLPPAPEITEVSPLKGKSGTPVLVLGKNFNQVGSVKFNGVAASCTILSDTVIYTGVPAGATTGQITVQSPFGTGASPQIFVVELGELPQITGFDPPSGPPGTLVTLTGQNLINVQSVAFNGLAAPFITDHGLQTVVPDVATTGPITVVTSHGSTTSASSFVVVRQADLQIAASVAVDSITALDQARFLLTVTNAGPLAATGVVVDGMFTLSQDLNPSNSTSVRFSNLVFTLVEPSLGSCSYTNGLLNWQVGTLMSNSSAVLSLQTAPLQPGVVRCLANVSAAESDPVATNDFAQTLVEIRALPPVITGFIPAEGVAGTSVLILGSNLIEVQSVTLGSLPASFSTNQDGLRITIPDGAASAPITVTTIHGATTSTESFVVKILPQITGFDPASGPPGTMVRLLGTGLEEATAVHFGGAVAAFSVTDGLTAVVPSNAVTGPITVSTAVGLATSPGSFTVDVIPVMLEVRRLDSTHIEISWSSPNPGWVLQTTINPASSASPWADSPAEVESDHGKCRIQEESTGTRCFYRLIRR